MLRLPTVYLTADTTYLDATSEADYHDNLDVSK